VSRAICSRAYLETNHDLKRTIILCGTGRSGTTWLARVLERILHYRIIFEPFHPQRVQEFGVFKRNQYARPDDDNVVLRSVVAKALSGRIRNHWVDQLNRSFVSRGRIVKEIRANFLLKWVRENFPEVPILYILRHPCAVVHSWQKMEWGTAALQSLLSQELLVKDHLNPYLRIIEEADTETKKIACVWCAGQLVALRTMGYSDWMVLTYEDLWRDAKTEIRKVVKYIRQDGRCDEINARGIIAETARKDSAVATKRDPLTAWERELTDRQIDEILGIVRLFSLDTLYDRCIYPHQDNLEKLLKHGIVP
jgi:hypothetical protein